MNTPDALRVIHRLVADVYNQGNLAIAEALYAPTVQLNDQPVTREDLTTAIRMLPQVLPGFRVTVEVLGIVDGLVVAVWTIRHAVTTPSGVGDCAAVRGTTGCTRLRLFQINEGRIVAEWRNAAAREMLHARGVWSLPGWPR